MNAKEFFDTVASMRHNQQQYFRTRSHIFLKEAKRLEAVVDSEITRTNGISPPPKANNEPRLFE
jgi:hypothetical protein